MMSQDELLGKKGPFKESNFRTQDRDFPPHTSVYNSLGNDNEQRLPLPFTDRNASSTINLHGGVLESERRSRDQNRHPSSFQNSNMGKPRPYPRHKFAFKITNFLP